MIRWPSEEYWCNNLEVASDRDVFKIKGLSSINKPKDNTLLFVKDLTDEQIDRLGRISGSLIITKPDSSFYDLNLQRNNGLIFDDNPRYCFASILQPFWDAASLRSTLKWDDTLHIWVGSDVSISASALIEPGVSIGSNSLIEDGVYIMAGAKIGPNVKIGANSIIRENAVVGGWGFGIAQKQGFPSIRIPHVGGVVIGEDVEIGALTTVCSGTIDPTEIHNNVKIDDHVHIAHNCIIEDDVVITACAEVSGSTRVGSNSYVAPNVSIVNGITIGEGALLGIGSVILKSVEAGSVMVGNPGRLIRKNTR